MYLRNRMLTLFGLILLATFCCSSNAHAGDGLVVHEWGTFTTLQDEKGQDLWGINVDDEPVPGFVYNINAGALSLPILSHNHWAYRSKGVPTHFHPVRMRLETPVIYFHPGANQKLPLTADVDVQFRGGWLTQFYPGATVSMPMTNGGYDFRYLNPDTVSGLSWKGLQIGTSGNGPKTEEAVWLAPRKVDAATVTGNSKGVGHESEKYLFYRGVGNLPAPLRTTMDRERGELAIHATFDRVLSPGSFARIPQLWLVHRRSDGTLAYRTLAGFDVSGDSKKSLATAAFRFSDKEFSSLNRERLEKEMQRALVQEGLNSDEAAALLATWQQSYFKSPGLRLFYMVPRVWTDFFLPLKVSGATRIERAMVGRIELISDEQRELLARLSKATISDGTWTNKIPPSPARQRFFAGHSDFGPLGVEIPADYRLYLQLGRFRNALLTEEEVRRPSPSLTKFINAYGLAPFRIPPVVSGRSLTPKANPR